jgi:hypothetical protein
LANAEEGVLPAQLDLPRPAGRFGPGTNRSAEGGRDQGRTRPGAALGPRTTGQSRTTAASHGQSTAQVSRLLRAFVQVLQSPGLSLARRRPGVQIPSPPPPKRQVRASPVQHRRRSSRTGAALGPRALANRVHEIRCLSRASRPMWMTPAGRGGAALTPDTRAPAKSRSAPMPEHACRWNLAAATRETRAALGCLSASGAGQEAFGDGSDWLALDLGL